MDMIEEEENCKRPIGTVQQSYIKDTGDSPAILDFKPDSTDCLDDAKQLDVSKRGWTRLTLT